MNLLIANRAPSHELLTHCHCFNFMTFLLNTDSLGRDQMSLGSELYRNKFMLVNADFP